MNTIDIVFGIILILGLIQGIRKGFFVELASLVGLIAGIYGAIHFSYYVADWLVEKTAWGEQIIKLTSFAITFVIIVLVVSLAGKLLTKVANFAMLGIVNKLLGAAFAVIKFAFLLSVVLMFIDAADRQISLIGDDNKEESILYPIVQPLAPALLPAIIKTAKDEDIYNPDKEKEPTETDDSSSI